MNGQITIEFLMVLAISISMILLFMPIFVNIYNNVLFYLDYCQATRVLSEINADMITLNSLDVDSYFTIKIDPIYTYDLNCQNDTIMLGVSSKLKSKIIKRALDFRVNCNLSITEKSIIKITKMPLKMIEITKVI